MTRQGLREFQFPGTPAITPEFQTSLQDAIHEPHQAARDRIIRSLAAGFYPAQKRGSRRLSSCCSTARLYVNPTLGKVRPWLNRCKHKLCPFCARARSATVAADLLGILKGMRHPRMMVLTVKSTSRVLSDQLVALRRAFSRLRRLPDWKTRVAGGAYTLEITVNRTSGLWHPHLHIIYDGEFFPHKLLQRHWHEVTGGSRVVWVSDVKNMPGVANELAKYIGKVQHLDKLTDQQIRDYTLAVNGSRMVQTFGTSHGIIAKDVDTQEEPAPGQYTISIPRLAYLAGKGHKTPLAILPHIARRWPVFASYVWHQHPQLEPEEHVVLRQARALARIRGHAPPSRAASVVTVSEELLDNQLMALFVSFHQQDQDHQYDWDENWSTPE